jgi:DNA invertase Pin-like site-specific DNA recombinase
MVYGYARCSTNETKQDVERQIRELRAMGAEELYFEYESGMKIERPELQKLLRHIKKGDTLVTTEISRITRSTKQLCDIIEMAVKLELKLVIGQLVVDCTQGGMDPVTESMIKVMGVFSELERNMTVERIKSGLKNAKAKGVRLGRPKMTAANVPKKVVEHFGLYKGGVINKTDFAKLCGVSKPSIYKYIRLLTDG